MNILFRKKILCEIKNHNELENFIIKEKFYKFFIKFPVEKHSEINHKISTTENLNFKSIRPWLRSILNYPMSLYEYDFLYCMGWEEENILNFISEKQKNNYKILAKKKNENPEMYQGMNNTRIEYWIKKGYSNDDAKKMLSKRQSTFNKEICITKYGEEKGIEVFNNRQIKWVNTLKKLPNYSEIQKKKNVYDYNTKNLDDMFKYANFTEKHKNVILKNINNPSVEDFVDKVLDEIDVKRYSDITPFYNSNLLSKKYNKSNIELKDIFVKKAFGDLQSSFYGTPVYYNKIRFKSLKEYELAIFLESKNISYIYEKNYPNSLFKFDFFIPDKNLYIEYYGMLDSKKEENLNELQRKYKEKMIMKNKFCEINKISLIQNTNFLDLINDLNKIL